MKKLQYIVLAILVLLALCIRVVPQIPIVFTPDGVMFKEVDDWYHMRLADVCYQNFPQNLEFDSYGTLKGVPVSPQPLMSWVIAGLGKILNFFKITNPLDTAGAVIPPIIGALTLIPLFFLTKRIAGLTGASVACLLTALLPNEFLHRTLLGFADHHCLEVLFTTCILCSVTGNKESFKNWLFGGVSLTLLLLTWNGGAFIVAVLALGVVILLLIQYLNKSLGPEAYYYCFIFLLPFVVLLLYKFELNITIVSLLFFLVPIFFILTRNLPRKVVLPILGVGLVLGVLGLVVYRGGVKEVLDLPFSVFGGINTTIDEAAPSSPELFFYGFGVSILILFLGIYLYFKSVAPNIPLVVFSIVILVATCFQRRWGYYLVIPLGIFTGLAVVELVQHKKKALQVALLVVTCLFLILPTIRGTIGLTGYPNLITKGWYNSLTWLKENSPEPFSNQGAYYSLEALGEPDYTVLTWWDYGHWVIRIAHRVPLTSPSYQALGFDFRFLTSQTEKESLEALKDLKVKYVVVDKLMVSDKFHPILRRYYPQVTKAEAVSLLPHSTMYQLWSTGNYCGFKLVHEEEGVKVFRRSL